MVYTWLKPTTQDANMPPPDQPIPSEKKSLSDLFAFAQNHMPLSVGVSRTELTFASDWVISINDKNSLYGEDRVTNKARCARRVNNLIVALRDIVKGSDIDTHTLEEIARQIIGVNDKGEPKLLVEITPKDRLIGLNNLLTMMLSADKREDARTRYQNQYKEVWNEEDLLLTKEGHGGNQVINKYDPAWDQMAELTEQGLVGTEGKITKAIELLNKHHPGWDTDEDNKKLYLKIILKSKAMGWNTSAVRVPEAWQAEVASLTRAFDGELTQGSQTEATPEQQIQLCEQVLTSLEQNAPDYVISLIQKDGLNDLRKRAKEAPQELNPKDILTLQEQTSIAVYNTLNRNNNWQLPSSRWISSQKADTGNHSTKLDADNQEATPLDAHNKDLKKFSNAQATLGEQTPQDSIFSFIIGQSQEVIKYNKELSDHSKDLHDYLKKNSAKIVSKPPFTTTAHNERPSNGLVGQAREVCLCKSLKNRRLD